VTSDLSFFVHFIAGRSYQPDGPTGVLAEAGLVLVVLASRTRLARASAARRVDWERWLPDLPFWVAVVAATSLVVRGRPLGGVTLATGVLVAGLVGLRHAVVSRDQQALTRRLSARERLFRSLVTSAPDLISLYDRNGNLLWASPSVSRALGAEVDTPDVPGGPVEGSGNMGVHVHPEDHAALSALWARALSRPGVSHEGAVRLRSRSGRWRTWQVVLRDCGDDPAVRGVVVSARDVHDERRLSAELAHAAYTDALTGLGNLARARQVLSERYACASGGATVVLLDLDGFKTVNDSFGHAKGDAVLVEVAARMRECLRSGDEAARLGGDEFVLVLEGDPGEVPQRLLEALARPVQVDGIPMTISASMGLADTAAAGSPDDVLRNADLAMYAAKAEGRNRAVAFAAGMHERAVQRLTVQQGLRRALDRGELDLHYQPIVELATGRLVGVEALVRWNDPGTGPVSPEVFIPLAEESGLVLDIDRWVLERGCADLARWRAAGLSAPRLSVNVSRLSLAADLPALVAGTLHRHALAPGELCVEVTESAVVQDAAIACAALAALRDCGVAVALDDFGTGESSLSQLARLPLDEVKIDRSFVRTCHVDQASRRLLRSIIGVCAALGLPVVAEGIEDADVLAALDGMGCRLGQGWHFGRPVPEPQLRRLLVASVPDPRRPARAPSPLRR